MFLITPKDNVIFHCILLGTFIRDFQIRVISIAFPDLCFENLSDKL